jgi:hypothetical protein
VGDFAFRGERVLAHQLLLVVAYFVDQRLTLGPLAVFPDLDLLALIIFPVNIGCSLKVMVKFKP